MRSAFTFLMIVVLVGAMVLFRTPVPNPLTPAFLSRDTAPPEQTPTIPLAPSERVDLAGPEERATVAPEPADSDRQKARVPMPRMSPVLSKTETRPAVQAADAEAPSVASPPPPQPAPEYYQGWSDQAHARERLRARTAAREHLEALLRGNG